ncbi:hypothetical protein AMTR_s00061p00086750 [Amborella trichopoda]|uniref:Disease resistance N-terminal domain-containing protein n=1 Tax=Amborella trichopoda TaxID=13333 RepID=U5DCB6_AMBTC|nr:hypothetical protein AMTR_s00061p00086750 [Amborella trichopoda]
MADSVVSFFLEKLEKLLLDEVQLLSGVEDDIRWIKEEVKGMEAFVESGDEKRETDKLVWGSTSGRYCIRCRGCSPQIHRGRGFRGCLISPCSSIKEECVKHEVASKIKE